MWFGKWPISAPNCRTRVSDQGRWHSDPSINDLDWFKYPNMGHERGYGTYQDFSSPYVMNIAHGIVHPVIGLSATLNQTLLTCGLRDIVPITDSKLAMELLYHKYQRALTSEQASSVVKNDINGYELGINQLGMSVVNSVLSKEDLDRLSFDQLLKYRQASSESMKAFHVLLGELRAEIENEPWSSKFELETRRIIDKKIRPVELKLRNDMKSTYEKMFGRIVGTIAKSATPAAVLSVMPGLGLAEALLFGATVGTGLASISIQPLIDTWAKQRELKRNGLAWLLEVK